MLFRRCPGRALTGRGRMSLCAPSNVACRIVGTSWYLSHVEDALAVADLVVCRSGANRGRDGGLGLPCIYVPRRSVTASSTYASETTYWPPVGSSTIKDFTADFVRRNVFPRRRVWRTWLPPRSLDAGAASRVG